MAKTTLGKQSIAKVVFKVSWAHSVHSTRINPPEFHRLKWVYLQNALVLRLKTPVQALCPVGISVQANQDLCVSLPTICISLPSVKDLCSSCLPNNLCTSLQIVSSGLRNPWLFRGAACGGWYLGRGGPPQGIMP